METEKETEIKVLFDVPKYSQVSLEEAPEYFDDFEYFDIYEMDGLMGEQYTAKLDGNQVDLVYVADGSLSRVFIYPENPDDYIPETDKELAQMLNVTPDFQNGRKNMLRYKNFDEEGHIYELKLMGNEIQLPTNIEMMLITFKR